MGYQVRKLLMFNTWSGKMRSLGERTPNKRPATGSIAGRVLIRGRGWGRNLNVLLIFSHI